MLTSGKMYNKLYIIHLLFIALKHSDLAADLNATNYSVSGGIVVSKFIQFFGDSGLYSKVITYCFPFTAFSQCQTYFPRVPNQFLIASHELFLSHFLFSSSSKLCF